MSGLGRAQVRSRGGMGQLMVLQHPRCRPGSGACPRANVVFCSVVCEGFRHLGRRTEEYAELVVTLEDGRGVGEADVRESGAG